VFYLGGERTVRPYAIVTDTGGFSRAIAGYAEYEGGSRKLARALRLPPSRVSDWRTGRRGKPHRFMSFATWAKLISYAQASQRRDLEGLLSTSVEVVGVMELGTTRYRAHQPALALVCERLCERVAPGKSSVAARCLGLARTRLAAWLTADSADECWVSVRNAGRLQWGIRWWFRGRDRTAEREELLAQLVAAIPGTGWMPRCDPWPDAPDRQI
jgi:hypothetical protein